MENAAALAARDLEQNQGPLLGQENDQAPLLGGGGARASVRQSDASDFAKQVKRDFVIKVYGILAAQILLTAGLIALCCNYPALGQTAEGMFFRWNPSLSTYLFSMLYYIPVFIVLGGLFMQGDKYPQNFLLLMLFTALVAFPAGGACYQLHASGQDNVILTALGLTAFIFITISLYVSCGSFDDGKMWFLKTFLYSALSINLWLGLFAIIFQWPLMMFAWNAMGVVIFSGYILFDTWLLLHKVEIEHVDTRTAIFGAINLYLDILNLFLHLLQLLGKRK